MQKLSKEQKDKIRDVINEKGVDTFVEFIQAKVGAKDSTVINLGASGFRINPCPSCGHNDALTVNDTGAGHCFSCNCNFHLSNLPALYCDNDVQKGMEILKEFTGPDIESFKEDEALTRKRQLYIETSKCYHQQLLENTEALSLLTDVRKRQSNTLELMQVGFCTSPIAVREHLAQLGYSEEEIRSVWVPERYFVFPYFDRYGIINHFNCKNYFNVPKSDGEIMILI